MNDREGELLAQPSREVTLPRAAIPNGHDPVHMGVLSYLSPTVVQRSREQRKLATLPAQQLVERNDRLATIGNAELGVDAAGVVLDRAQRQHRLLGDLARVEPLDDVARDLHLPLGERELTEGWRVRRHWRLANVAGKLCGHTPGQQEFPDSASQIDSIRHLPPMSLRRYPEAP